ncbi:MAG: hypothetical protein AUH85_17990 [Chloroflexi bacterium 13_1_40CM_4_68_4]|nr:MAG: hypothetical protein AUH85_17990 [Chloroflexi bacterium 13_1_40CM_4_68_4]
MAATGSDATATSDREIVLTRVFDAPRELVFKTWIDREQVAQRWGPNGTNTTHEMDVRPGGGGNQTLDRLAQHLAKM